MKHILASVFALAILASCSNEAVESTVEETNDTTIVLEGEEVVVEEVSPEEVVEAEGELASEE